ncbi:MAG: T9SS type A sorting domain-containing protein, partial [Bacteroidota bacterium]
PTTAAAPVVRASDTDPAPPAPLAFDSMPLIVLSAAELMEGFQVRITYRHNDTFDQQQVEFLLARDTNFRQSADTQVAPWFYSNRDGFLLTDLLNGTFFGRPMQQVTITKRHRGSMLTKKVLFNKLGTQLPPDTVMGKRFAAMEQRFQRSLNDHLLLPIWVRPDSLITHPEILNGMIFWFPANQQVFNRLPAAIGEPLRQEFEAISGSVPPAVPGPPAPPPPPPPPPVPASAPVPPAAPSCQYFESCPTDFKGLDDLKVYPNPARGHVNLTFNLLQSYHLQVNLVDIQGKPVANLMPLQAVSGGRHQYQLNLAGITPGMYLMVVTSADGTSSAKRLLIR